MERNVDRFIAGLPAQIDGDLMLCRAEGVAYQRDMTVRVPYDDSYFDKCAGYEDQAIAVAINAGRIDLVNRHVGHGFPVLDIGIGSGEFIRKRPRTFGHDVNPKAIAWLKEKGWWSDDIKALHAFTFWDVIEHVDEPEQYFRQMAAGAFVFASLPVFGDLGRIRESRHYRPGEHLYYWTAQGFIDWMALHGFALLERADFETRAGRDSIESFAFRRSPYEIA